MMVGDALRNWSRAAVLTTRSTVRRKMASNGEVTHFANIEDKATGEGFEEFVFPKVGSHRGRLLVERENAFDSRRSCRGHPRNLTQPLSNPDEARSQVQRAIKLPPLHLLRHTATRMSAPTLPRSSLCTRRSTRKITSRRTILPPRLLNDAQLRSGKPRGNSPGGSRAGRSSLRLFEPGNVCAVGGLRGAAA